MDLIEFAQRVDGCFRKVGLQEPAYEVVVDIKQGVAIFPIGYATEEALRKIDECSLISLLKSLENYARRKELDFGRVNRSDIIQKYERKKNVLKFPKL